MTAAALAQLRAEKHISVSALTKYAQRCPDQYRHRYILETPPAHRSAALPFGSAIHEALAVYYRALMQGDEPPPLELLDQTFIDAWHRELSHPVAVIFDDKDDAQSLEQQGLALLAVFFESAPRPHRVLAVEEPFSIELHDPDNGQRLDARLVGVFDALVEDENGAVHILEHKTAKRRYTRTRLDHDWQPTAYSLAAKHLGLTGARVTYQLLLKQKTPTFFSQPVARTSRDHHDFLRAVSGVLRAIEAGAFYPVRDWWCTGCPYASKCLAG